MTNELITICITTYNRKAALQLSIQSVLSQTYSNFELIIVDDCSTDGTQQLVESEILNTDTRIRYIRHKVNQGLSAARNTAINHAKGKYFTFVDDDDRWDERFLETFNEIAKETANNYIFCASNISNLSKNPVTWMDANLKDLLYLGFTPPVASQFYRTDEIKQIGGYDLEIKSGVDHDLWIAFAAANFNIIWINETLTQINDVPSDSRMTFNFEKRSRGIKNSLAVWQRKYSDDFEDNFFSFLVRNYRYNTHKKFLLVALHNYDFWGILKHIISLPIVFFGKDLSRYIVSKIGAKPLLERPNFQSCLTGKESRKLYQSFEIHREP